MVCLSVSLKPASTDFAESLIGVNQRPVLAGKPELTELWTGDGQDQVSI
jgi:hypothetical protein